MAFAVALEAEERAVAAAPSAPHNSFTITISTSCPRFRRADISNTALSSTSGTGNATIAFASLAVVTASSLTVGTCDLLLSGRCGFVTCRCSSSGLVA